MSFNWDLFGIPIMIRLGLCVLETKTTEVGAIFIISGGPTNNMTSFLMLVWITLYFFITTCSVLPPFALILHDNKVIPEAKL